MRVLICGDRRWTDYGAILRYLNTLPANSTVIEGEARGADKLARLAARQAKPYLHVERFPADWERYGRAAGPIRNTQMLREGVPDRVVAFHTNLAESKGTRNMIEQAQRAGIPTEVRP